MDIKSLIFLLLQALVCFSYADGTILQSNANSCFIFRRGGSDVTLYCNRKKIDLNQIKKDLDSIKDSDVITVQLYGLTIGTVPSNFFAGYNIKSLTIAYCKLDSLRGGGGKPLEGLEDTLERLVIDGSLTNGDDFRNSALSHLRNLREIDFESNSLGKIGNDWFKNPPPLLSSVIFSSNQINAMEDRVLAEIPTLEFVVFSKTKLGPVTRSMLPNPAERLNVLHLIDIGLKNISEKIFTNMPNLKMVSLAENSINNLPENIWKPVWKKLREIDLSENPLQCDSHMNWMTSERTCAKISATCASPAELSDKFPPQITSGKCRKTNSPHLSHKRNCQ